MRQLCLVATLIICAFAPWSQAAQAQNELHDISYSQLVSNLNGYSLEQRADFIHIALNHLADSFHRQAQRARMAAKDNSPKSKRARRWAASVDRYANNLTAQANTLDREKVIQISINRDNNAQIRVGEHAILITSPNPKDQGRLERAIAEQFCKLHNCDVGVIYDPLTQLDRQTKTRWSFQEYGPACRSDEGILLQFSTLKQLGQKRKVCQQVSSELLNVAHTLKQLQNQGSTIIPELLSIRNRTLEGEVTIIINQQGQSIQLLLPSLSLTPTLFMLAKPWLRARLQNREASLLIEDAEKLTQHLVDRVDQ
ncbi:hypothetical protein EDC56_0465 [Sinobacterium caligoides]|uniref:LPP20 lipoprotein n=1 Tax=Sinobacterium caligoides TaxID=933926 RepID=A0A3N2DYQ2_9GAMM|nr:hypothetical protein [Sinobacterium caligoides]ROS04948.1 hypothetical protein EDC56_0465 [Sinobacterium caligoides]